MKRILLQCCLLLLLAPLNRSDIRAACPLRGDAVNALARTKAKLAISANIYFGDQDEEVFPVKTDFYLLDRSFVEILKSTGFQPEFAGGEEKPVTDEDYLEAAAKAFASQDEADAQVIVFLLDDRIKQHHVAAADTNLYGRGAFPKVPVAEYYLFGIASTEAETLVWNLPVEVTAGGNAVEIDQTNAAVIFSIGD